MNKMNGFSNCENCDEHSIGQISLEGKGVTSQWDSILSLKETNVRATLALRFPQPCRRILYSLMP